MNTPTHMIIAAALGARRNQPGTLAAALAGGLIPDVPLIAMVVYATRIEGIPQSVVFGELYFSDSWQTVFAVDHSFFVWGALLAAALFWRLIPLAAFAGGGLAHAAADFVTHNDDARQQFWPFSDWVFNSPVSYWDPAYWGNVVAPIEALLVAVLTAWLLYRLRSWWQRGLVLAVAGIHLVPIVLSGGFHGIHGLS